MSQRKSTAKKEEFTSIECIGAVVRLLRGMRLTKGQVDAIIDELNKCLELPQKEKL